MSRRLIGAAVAGLLSAGCNGIVYPSSPSTTSAATATVYAVSVVASPLNLPAGGGTVTVHVNVLATGGGPAAYATVDLFATSGTLAADSVTTDVTGNAKTEWRTTTSGTVSARVGELQAASQVTVTSSTPTPDPSNPGPVPGPSPAPPPPGPTPTDPITVSVVAPRELYAGEPATFSAAISSPSPFEATSIEWDFTGDGRADRTGNPVSWTFASIGLHSAMATVTAADGRRASGHVGVFADPTDLITGVTLSFSRNPIKETQAVTITATVTTRTGRIPSGLSYAWDVELGDGRVDAITETPSTTVTYPIDGTVPISLTITGSDGRRPFRLSSTVKVERVCFPNCPP